MDKQVDFVEILEAKESGNRSLLNEASLYRVYAHVRNTQNKSFAIITSYRNSNAPLANKESFKQLQSTIRSMGLGYNKLVGHWQESQNSEVTYDKAAPEELVDATEPSLFITGITLQDALSLGIKYNQDAIVYSGVETNGKVVLVFRDGSTSEIGEFTPHKIAQAYSTIKGKNFVFEYKAQSWIETTIETNFNKNKH